MSNNNSNNLKDSMKVIISMDEYEDEVKDFFKLANLHGTSGEEEKIRDFIKKRLEPIVDEIVIDSLGNLIVFIKGNNPNSDEHIYFDAHMDEIGFQVKYIEKNGFIRVSAIGGQNPRVLPGNRIVIHSFSGDMIYAVFGEKPIHHLSPDERKKTSKIEDLFVDAGFSTDDEAKKHLHVGDFATFDQYAIRIGKGSKITGKSFDDRIGCWILLRTLEKLSNSKIVHPSITAAFVVQEEIGLRGATVSAFRAQEKITKAIALEVSHALDYPKVNKAKYGEILLGNGPVIPVGPNVDKDFVKRIIEVAKEKNIPIQMAALSTPASNDARIIQITRSGISTGLVKVALRYMHTPTEVADFNDIIFAIKLIIEYLKSL